MLAGSCINLHYSPIGVVCGNRNSVRHTNMGCNSRQACVVMGPVVASLAMYAVERLLTRVMAGQLLRKGICRKAKRLFGFMMSHSVLHDVLDDIMDDVSDVLWGML
jgi:hypothetical protein